MVRTRRVRIRMLPMTNLMTSEWVDKGQAGIFSWQRCDETVVRDTVVGSRAEPLGAMQD
jgi:hypothetical protein